MSEAIGTKNIGKETEEFEKRQKTILVVEDDQTHRALMDKILTSSEFQTVQAENGLVALSKIDAGQHFDLIFMDWQMPVMDGHEAIRNIRMQSWGEDLKIIALTANAIHGDKEKCLKVGADDYMSKPVRVLDMIKILQKHLSGCVAKVA